MNGSNHLKESDSRPMHLCPVCLHKLQYSIGFDVVERYAKLFHFYKKVGFDDEAQWLAKRLKWIFGAEAARAIIEEKNTR
jgi:archaemetzincin